MAAVFPHIFKIHFPHFFNTITYSFFKNLFMEHCKNICKSHISAEEQNLNKRMAAEFGISILYVGYILVKFNTFSRSWKSTSQFNTLQYCVAEPPPGNLQYGGFTFFKGLDIPQIGKTPLIYSVSYFNLGRMSPPKDCCVGTLNGAIHACARYWCHLRSLMFQRNRVSAISTYAFLLPSHIYLRVLSCSGVGGGWWKSGQNVLKMAPKMKVQTFLEVIF